MRRPAALLPLFLGLWVLRGLAGPSPLVPPAKEGEDRLNRVVEALTAHRPAEALRLAQEVLAGEPGHRQARFLASHALNNLGRMRESIAVLEELVRDFPDDHATLNNLAWLLATAPEDALRDPKRAVVLARRALMSAPDNYSVWSTLAEAHDRAGDYARALQSAQEALRQAREQKAPEQNLMTYDEQLVKCQNAVQVFTLQD